MVEDEKSNPESLTGEIVRMLTEKEETTAPVAMDRRRV